jgi:radical SAM superfamily enzyme YgiQ (UPF0313 family)
VKILLIYPYCLEERPHTDDAGVVPIGLYYVGALLKENNYDVEILNWHDVHKTPERISKAITEKKPDVIGFSILHANRWGGIEIARIAKVISNKVKIVFGGIGASFLWEHFLRHFKEIDFIITGEGEYSFLNLVRCIERENDKDFEKIRGVAFRKKDSVVKTKDAPLTKNLDRLPNPAKYFDYQYVSSTRGCPGNCAFCGSPRFWGHKVRFHSPDYFVEQLEILSSRGIRFFYFSDDTFTIKKIHVIEICKKILEKNLGITWVAISRVNTVDEEILYWMRRAGCIQISYGVESGSEKIRDLLCKNIKTGQIKKAFKLTVRYSILARAYFIYGSPGENWTTIKETMDLIHEIKPLSIIFYILDIFPGTALYSDFRKRPGVTDDIWLNRIEDIMYFETDPNLSQELILAFGERLRTDYYDHLADFVNEIELIDDEGFYQMHADFLSRLAMTFTHGDYARIEEIKGKENIAEGLYKKALTYHPDHRAYLGLGIIAQKKGAYEASAEILSKGIGYFPDSEPLSICLGISFMNLGEYAEALSIFLKFQNSKQAPPYIAQCYHALGESEKETEILKQLDSH